MFQIIPFTNSFYEMSYWTDYPIYIYKLQIFCRHFQNNKYYNICLSSTWESDRIFFFKQHASGPLFSYTELNSFIWQSVCLSISIGHLLEMLKLNVSTHREKSSEKHASLYILSIEQYLKKINYKLNLINNTSIWKSLLLLFLEFKVIPLL